MVMKTPACHLALGLVLSLTLVPNFARAQVQAATQIVLLGTGTPNADPDRAGPAVAVMVNGKPYLVDFGPGVVRRAAAAARKGVAGLEVKNLQTAFVTHLHSDHTLGYADLIFTPWVLERDAPLAVYGPTGLKAMTKHIVQAYAEDIDIRLNGLEPANETGYKVVVHEIAPGVIYQDQDVTVKAFPVNHGSWKQAFGLRFETRDRTIVISGDCTPSPALIANSMGCDVLIHEVYSTTGFAKRPPVWQRYHSNFHTSSKQLAEIANQVKPDLLVLYHQLFWGTTDEELENEIRQFYDGKVVSGRDLDVF